MTVGFVKERTQRILDKNTFYFFNQEFENEYDSHINSIKELMVLLKQRLENGGFRKEIFEEFLVEKENGLKAILTLNGISNESLKRIITLLRIVEDQELSRLIFREKWDVQSDERALEFSDDKISDLVKTNSFFRKGLVNLFFEGATVPFLVKTIPPFELKKFGISKLNFDMSAMLDTLVRYKEKGSYSGKKFNNPELLISQILKTHSISYETGDLSELVSKKFAEKRTMDFIIPNKKAPKIIIESSFLVTTSSGQGDKSKTEASVGKLIKKYYKNCSFIGFVDGIGWYVRRGDLERMVRAYDDVFTFRQDELDRFVSFIKTELNR